MLLAFLTNCSYYYSCNFHIANSININFFYPLSFRAEKKLEKETLGDNVNDLFSSSNFLSCFLKITPRFSRIYIVLI